MTKLLTLLLIASIAVECALFIRGLEHQRAWHEEQLQAIQCINAKVDNINAKVDGHEREQAEVSRGAGRVITVEATAYTSAADECGKDDGITASGRPAIPGYTVATDGLPLGTRLVIDGDVCEVMDRIGDGDAGHIDLHVASKAEAREFGRRMMRVEVLP